MIGTKLLKGERFVYGQIQYEVDGVWYSPSKKLGHGVPWRYDIVNQRGKIQSQLASVIHDHVDSGAIRFIN